MYSRESYSSPYYSTNYDNIPKYEERYENAVGREEKERRFAQQVVTPSQPRNVVSRTNSYLRSSEFSQRDYQRIREMSLNKIHEREPNSPTTPQHLQQPPQQLQQPPQQLQQPPQQQQQQPSQQQQHLALIREASYPKNKPEDPHKYKEGFGPHYEEPIIVRYSKKHEYRPSNAYGFPHGDVSSNIYGALPEDPRNRRYKNNFEIHPNKINYREHNDISVYKNNHQSKDHSDNGYGNLGKNIHNNGYDYHPMDLSSKRDVDKVEQNFSIIDKKVPKGVNGNQHDTPSKNSTSKIDREKSDEIQNSKYEVLSSQRYSSSSYEDKVKKRYSDDPVNFREVNSNKNYYQSDYRHSNEMGDRSININKSRNQSNNVSSSYGSNNGDNYQNFAHSPPLRNKPKLPPHFINIYAIKPEYAKKSAVSPKYYVNSEVLPERYDRYDKNHKVPPHHNSDGRKYSSHLQPNTRTTKSSEYEKDNSNHISIERYPKAYYNDRENSAKYGHQPNVVYQQNKARESSVEPRPDSYSKFSSKDNFNPYKEFYGQNNLEDKIVQEQYKNNELVIVNGTPSSEIPYSLEGLYNPPKDGQNTEAHLKRSSKYNKSEDEAATTISEESRTPAKLIGKMLFKNRGPVVPFPDYTLPRNLVPVVLPPSEASDPTIFIQKVYTHDIGDY